MKLSEIINVEYQLYKDAASDIACIQERDRKIGLNFTGQLQDRASMFRFWSQSLMHKDALPGSWFDSALTFLRYLVFFFFLVSGALTCAGLLNYDGSQPVNIVNFIAVFAGLNLLLYLLFLLNMLPGSYGKKIPFIGDFYRLAGFLLKHLVAMAGKRLYRNRSKAVRFASAVFYRIESRHIIYQGIEQWLLFSITQLGGFAFSLGALISCTYLVIFSDLAFAWNTTLNVSPEYFHRIVTLISLPWSIFNADLVPTLGLVESTRFFRLEGSYSGIYSDALTAGGWWPFLLCIIIFYGLVPRLFLMTASVLRLRFLLKKAPWFSAELDSLYRRLTSPMYASRSGNNIGTSKKGEKWAPAAFDVQSMDARSCRVILWGEAELDDAVIKKAVETLFGWSTLDIARAGGLDIRQDDDILESFKGGTPEPVLFLAESWEAPGRAVLYFLSSLRNITDKEQRIIVGLINIDHEKGFMAPARADWQNWHETVSRLNDPFIAIEPVTGVMK